VLLDDSGFLVDQDDHLEIEALQRMARREVLVVTRGVPMLNWLALVLKMTQMLPEGLRKRKVSHGISISVKRLELAHHHDCSKM